MTDSTAPDTCFHCGQPVPAGVSLAVEIDGRTQPMCCHGCQAVARAIVSGGLTDFYRFRDTTSPTAREVVPAFLQETAVYDSPSVQKSFVRHDGEHEREASLILEGIVCAACVWLNEQHLRKLPGVLAVQINYATRRARVKWDERRIHLSDILRAVADIGYLAHPYDPDRAQQLLDQERRGMLRRLAIGGAFGMQVMMIAVALYAGDWYGIEPEYRRFFEWLSLLLTLPVLGYAGLPFYQSAWRDLRRRSAGMDVPVALGLSIAFTGSVWATVTGHGEVYFDSVVMFITFLLAGRYFELAARKRAAESSESLVRHAPAMAVRLVPADDGWREETLAAADLAVGDRVRVLAGAAIPTDGRLVGGRTSVDESLLTGESLPVAKTAGDRLVGGSLNIESPIEMIVTHTGEDTVLSAMLRLLDRAQTEKPAIALAADRAARWFVLRILLLATGVALFWLWHSPGEWLPITVSVLVVTCPCALSLATPAAMTAVTGSLTQRGILITRGHALETLARATHFVFDKTGTLTQGRLRLVATETFGALDATHCLTLAAALEQHSEHPIARALRQAEQGLALPAATDVVNTPGAGLTGHIEGQRYALGTLRFVTETFGLTIDDPRYPSLAAQGHSLVLLASDAGPLALFAVGDSLRPGARELVSTLQALGKEVILLSGDHAPAAQHVAQQLGITRVIAEARPDDKLRTIQRLRDEGAIVAMTGDGVNDAASLAGAHVSIALGSGTQLAAASADIILLAEDLRALIDTRRLALRAMTIIRQNMRWAVGYNLSVLPLAALGYIAPWMAAIGMSLSSVLVVANALRLVEAPTRPAVQPESA